MFKLSSMVAAGFLSAVGGIAMGIEPEVGPPPDPKTVEGVSEFTIDLYRVVSSSPGNVFCSPLNVATALGMTAAGAKGETAAQIERTLHLGGIALDGLGPLADAIGGAIKPPNPGEGEGVWSANAGWFDESEEILADFIARLERSYRAEPHRVDFARSPDAARETINRWVADQTREKIVDLLKPEHIRPGTSFVLTSAIYFKGSWAFPFRPESTTDDTFKAVGGPVPIRLMNQTASRLPYAEDDEVQVATLPYKDGTLSMLVVLPKKGDGLATVEAGLTAEKVRGWAEKSRPSRVKLSLPRFKTTAEIDLRDVLSSMGMPDAFDPEKADFSGITGDRKVSISVVVHKAYVEVEEKGTEAAAATAVIGVRSSAMLPQKEIEFRADRPFLYLIRDSKTGAILFIGRLSRP